MPEGYRRRDCAPDCRPSGARSRVRVYRMSKHTEEWRKRGKGERVYSFAGRYTYPSAMGNGGPCAECIVHTAGSDDIDQVWAPCTYCTTVLSL